MEKVLSRVIEIIIVMMGSITLKTAITFIRHYIKKCRLEMNAITSKNLGLILNEVGEEEQIKNIFLFLKDMEKEKNLILCKYDRGYIKMKNQIANINDVYEQWKAKR